MNNPVYLELHNILSTQVLQKISYLFHSHIYAFDELFVCTKTVTAVFLTALKRSL